MVISQIDWNWNYEALHEMTDSKVCDCNKYFSKRSLKQFMLAGD